MNGCHANSDASTLKRKNFFAFRENLRAVAGGMGVLVESPPSSPSVEETNKEHMLNTFCFTLHSGFQLDEEGGHVCKMTSGDWSLGASGARPHLLSQEKKKRKIYV